jgi:hypothetical protein
MKIKLEPKIIEVRLSSEGNGEVLVRWEWLINGETFGDAVGKLFPFLSGEEVAYLSGRWLSPTTFAGGMDLERFDLELIKEALLRHKHELEGFLSLLHKLNLYKKLIMEKLVEVGREELNLDVEEEIKEYVSKELGMPVKSVELSVDKSEKITATEEGLVVRANLLNYHITLPIAVERFRLELPFPEEEEEDYINEPLYFAWSLKSYIKRTNPPVEKYLSMLDKELPDSLGLYLVKADYGLVEPFPEDDDYWVEYREVEI